jgi:hypothetical protein
MQVLHHCANPCNTLIITRSWSRGKRFESARRLSRNVILQVKREDKKWDRISPSPTYCNPYCNPIGPRAYPRGVLRASTTLSRSVHLA